MKVLIDTGAWLGIFIENDPYSDAAQAYYKKLKKQRVLLYTNEHILDEVYTRMIYDVHLKAAETVHRKLMNSVAKEQLHILEIPSSCRPCLQLLWSPA